MMFPASFLPRVAFAWRASRACPELVEGVAALAPLTHAAAQAGWFEKLSGGKYGFGKVLFTQNSRRYLFDIAPSRHLMYQSSWTGLLHMRTQLREALNHALTPAPYLPLPDHKTSFPLEIDLSQERDSIDLLSPPMLHRRKVSDGLEFGSLYIFPNSWLTIGNDDHSQVNLEATMRFSDRTPNLDPSEGWIGIALRSQHFFANYGYLTYVRPDGTVWHTEPFNELQYRYVPIDSLEGFNLSEFVTFHLNFGPDTFQIRINEISKTIDLKNVPHARYAGKIRFQTHLCRAVLKYFKVDVTG